jgi:CBS domain-containing protein
MQPVSRIHAQTPNGGDLPVTVFVAENARIAADATIVQVAEALSAAEVGALLVGDGDTVSAIVSERDLVHALASGLDPTATIAGDIAHTTLIRCDVTATVGQVALRMMEQYVRHILVDSGGRLAGIVSARDLLGAYVAAQTTAADDGSW